MTGQRRKRRVRPSQARAARVWPYPLWERHHREEPAYALLARTVERNLPGTLSARLFDFGAYGGHSVTKASVVEIARVCEVDPMALERSTPRVGPKYATMLGERFRRDDFSVARRRWCPVCLSEHGCHLAWWDLTIVTSCPRHRVGLIDRCSCGLEIGWKRQLAFSNCACGQLLADVPAVKLADDEGLSDRYIVGRLTGIDRVPIPFLDRLSLLNAIEVLRNVGHLAINPLTRRRAVETETGFRRLLDAGYQGVAEFPASFRTLLDRKLAEAVVPEGKRGTYRVYGFTFLHWLTTKEPEALQGTLSAEVRGHAARHLKLQHRKLFGVVVDRRKVGLPEAAAICGVSYVRMKRILVLMGLVPKGHVSGSASFDRSAIEELASSLKDGVTVPEVAYELNVWPKFMPGLIRAGIVPPPILDGKGSTLTLMPADAAQVLMNRLRSAVTPGADGGQGLPIPLASKSLGISMADLVAEILAGSIPAVGVLPDERGLSSILVDVAGQRAARRMATSETMTAGDIARKHGISWEDACGLLGIGAITAERDGKVWAVDKDVADEFFRIHTALGPYAKRLKTSAKYLALSLEAAGFRPVYSPPSTIRKFFKRAEIEAYLDREGWPPKDWRVRHALPEGTYVIVPPGSALPPSGSQRP